MVSPNIPSTISFSNGQSVSNYYKSFTNFMNIQSQIYSHLPFAIYDSNKGFKSLSYSTVDRLATNLACKWHKYINQAEVVSFVSDHNVDYLIVVLAVMKLRVTLMLISPRNSKNAAISLLEKTKSKLLITSTKYEPMAKFIAETIPDTKVITVDFMDIQTMIKEPLNPDHKICLNTEFTEEDIRKSVLILHSSGSTSFPKPLYFSNQYVFNLINYYKLDVVTKGLGDFGETDSCLSCVPLLVFFC